MQGVWISCCRICDNFLGASKIAQAEMTLSLYDSCTSTRFSCIELSFALILCRNSEIHS
ncbi:unnamed protein product [Linum tenue]|uniref:Uncharacterized protein n=1 Tax=Linum tenue TaxID=586396 RepID=A0AAV0H2A5_9ROSI|nr:unnamed protein product [Linum tenue]